jgi:hypothetical protein
MVSFGWFQQSFQLGVETPTTTPQIYLVEGRSIVPQGYTTIIAFVEDFNIAALDLHHRFRLIAFLRTLIYFMAN